MHPRWSLTLCALVLAAPSALLAQGEAGLKGGVSFGNISNKGLLPGNLSNRTGFAGGIYAQYHVASWGSASTPSMPSGARRPIPTRPPLRRASTTSTSRST